MASTDCDSTFDLETLLADAQDLVDESFVARALLQPETNPWETFPLGLLYPAHEPSNEAHHSFLIGSAANSLAEIEPIIKSEPVEDVDLLSTVSQHQCDLELDEYLNFQVTHEDLTIASPATTVLLSSSPIDNSDVPLLHSDEEHAAGYSYVNEQLECLDTNNDSTCATISSSSSPTEETPLLELAQYFYITNHLDHPITASVTADSTSISITDTSPATTASSTSFSFSPFFALTALASPPATIASLSLSLFSSSFPSTISSESTSSCSSNLSPSDALLACINTEDVPCPTVALDGPAASEPQLDFEESKVRYTFVDPHEKPRKRRAKGIKNSTPIACTFCRRRKIRCGGPQEGGGVCKSCIRLNRQGECVFPAVSYRGQRRVGSNSSSKRKSTSTSTSKGALPPSKSS